MTARMDANECVTCKEVVQDGVCCERCEGWFHYKCVDLPTTKAAQAVLGNALIVFLCTVCLETSRKEWRSKKEGKASTPEDEATQRDLAHPPKEQVEQATGNGGEKEKAGCAKCVQREKTGTQPARMKGIKRTAPITVIGDSMVRHVDGQLAGEARGCSVESLRGARIGAVKRKVVEKAGELEDGLLVIQGGGNDLEDVGTENTVKEVVEAVKAVEGKKMSVAVVGIMRRPCEGERYETIRKRTNVRLHEELLKVKVEWMKERKGNVSFLDLDGVLREGMDFAADRVHLNRSGLAGVGKRLREWRNARLVQCVSA